MKAFILLFMVAVAVAMTSCTVHTVHVTYYSYGSNPDGTYYCNGQYTTWVETTSPDDVDPLAIAWDHASGRPVVTDSICVVSATCDSKMIQP